MGKNVNKSLLFIFALSIIGLLVFSCKKSKAFNSEEGQTLVDITSIRSQTDRVLIEANEAISTQFFLRGRPSGAEGVQASSSLSNCAFNVDTSLVYSGVLKFNYSGSICDNYKREGQVVVTLLNYPTKKWKDRGCILKLDFNNYIATNVSENKSIKFSGTEFITNESGGTWYELKYLNLAQVVSTISGSDIKVTFDKTINVYCNIERRITYTIKGGIISGSSDGIATQNNTNNVECWGVNRDEKDFTSKVENAIVWNATCSSLKPISGQVNVTVNGDYYDLEALYGTDADGNIINSSDCAYGWKMTWSLRNKTKKRVFNY